MKKQIILRGILGALGGILIGQIVLIIISLCLGNGEVQPVPPALAEQVGSELTAYILQTLAVMLYGSVWAAASIVWEIDGWSLTRQTIVHGLCYSLSALPIAWLMHWFPHTWTGFLGYIGGFVVLYASMWLAQYLGMKRRIKVLNAQLEKR
ncbi:MAG: DUF3021 domain-containing protein [Clostridia bacterium]|nr:DUF3021 domain-containing protein [Clostridia bacterium]